MEGIDKTFHKLLFWNFYTLLHLSKQTLAICVKTGRHARTREILSYLHILKTTSMNMYETPICMKQLF